MGPQSGDLASLGKPSLQACEMAVDAFNRRTGGVDGLTVQLEPVDDRDQPLAAVDEAKQLAADRAVLGVVGPMSSGAALAAAPLLDAAHVGFVSQSASIPKLTESAWTAAHRLSARDDALGPAAAVFLFGRPVYAKRAVVLDANEPGTVSLADEFQKRALALGMNVERMSLAGHTQTNVAAAVARVIEAKPDALFLPMRGAPCGSVAQEVRRQGALFAVMAAGGCQSPSEGMFLLSSTPAVESTPAGQAWRQEFSARFGALPAPFSAEAFDAAGVVLQAIGKAATVKGGLDLHPADVNAQLGRTSGFAGLLGPISFDGRGDVPTSRVYVGRWTAGALQQVKVFAPAA